MREEAALAGLPGDFSVIEEEGEHGRRALIAELFQLSASEVDRRAEAMRRDPDCEDARRLREALIARGQVDFDALIDLPVHLLSTHPDLAERWRARFDHICVDEYQDIDERQYRLVQLIAPPEANLCAIGDPDQAIYGFRGASVGFFLRFVEDHPGAHEVTLTRNYRSSPTIVAAALEVISPQTLVRHRVLEPTRQSDIAQIQLFEAPGERAEADWIAETIEARLGGTSHRAMDARAGLGHTPADTGRELGFSDFAILYRTDAQATALMEALTRRSLPFQKSGHDRLSSRRGVRRLRDAMRHLVISGECAQLSAGETLLKVVRALGEQADSRDPEIALAFDLIRPLAAQAKDAPALITLIEQGHEVDALDSRAERVSLLTLHASKGLEFPVVFIAGCEDGLIPLCHGLDPLDDASLAEERRLFFVGVTRARDELFLSRVKSRTIFGAERAMAPSPFLSAMDQSRLTRLSPAPPKRRARQLKLF